MSHQKMTEMFLRKKKQVVNHSLGTTGSARRELISIIYRSKINEDRLLVLTDLRRHNLLTRSAAQRSSERGPHPWGRSARTASRGPTFSSTARKRDRQGTARRPVPAGNR